MDNLLEGGTYKDKAASGIFCVNLEDLMKLQFKMKNGKINGGMRIAFYHEKDKPVFDTYISDYSIFTDFDNVFDDNGLPNYEFLKNKKIDLNSKVYYENGNIQVNCTTINGQVAAHHIKKMVRWIFIDLSAIINTMEKRKYIVKMEDCGLH